MECPPRGLRRGRLVLGGRPPTLDLIENPLYEAEGQSPVPAPRTLPPARTQQQQQQQQQQPKKTHQPAAMHHTYPPTSQQSYGGPRGSSAQSSLSSAVVPTAVVPADDDVEVRRRPKLSRSETIKRYVRKNTASFFGLDEESAPESCQRWTLRRKRLLSKRYGEIKASLLP
ncbi:hypothetical protein HPB51_008500 [Rhipicephalus microplus]|uniref:Uncharacterized protein n=1 Tax=Rhipicephalus microplus TaxID=6941 RepID=A0A9J6ESA5_RHIMP|nr:hypothetical protein HPB51_008500 [Rhipicephalus microplus]